MQTFLQSHRWVILAAGAAIQIFTGVPAAWGVFQKPVCEGYGLEQNAAALIFSCVIAAFGVGCVLGGWLQDKKGPRAAGVSGTVLLSAGFVAAAFVPEQTPWLFYLGFSVPVGCGCAFLYPAVMSCAQKWYSGRKGLATGVVGGAVGLSGAVLTLLGRGLIGAWGIRTAFWVLGAVMALVCGGACVVLENPKENTQSAAKEQKAFGKATACKKLAAGAAKKAGGPAHSHTVRQMLRTPQYGLLTACVCFATPAVLLFSPVIVELAQERGLSQTAALACIVVGSFFSAGGRLCLPWMSDRTGRRLAYVAALGALAALSVGFAFAQSWWVLAAYGVLTFFYSGEAAVLPAAVTDLFGAEHAGVNYGFAALGMSVGSLGFPLLARLFSEAAARHWIAAAAAGAGLLCALLLKPTQGERL